MATQIYSAAPQWACDCSQCAISVNITWNLYTTPDSRQLLKLICVEKMSFHSLLNLSKLHIYNIFEHPK